MGHMRAFIPLSLLCALALTSATTTINPAYAQCSASAVYDGDAVGTGHGTGRLDSAQGWSAKNTGPWLGEWWQMDLGSTIWVAGVVTQGRKSPHDGQAVTSYKVKVSTDGGTFTDVDGGATFTGNSANTGDAKVEKLFASPVQGRYVRILPQTWASHITMRSAVLEASSGYSSGYQSSSAQTPASSPGGGSTPFYGNGNAAIQIVQKLTFSSLSVADFPAAKSSIECAMGITLTIASNTCVYDTGASVSATAARRAITVTFTSQVPSAKSTAANTAANTLSAFTAAVAATKTATGVTFDLGTVVAQAPTVSAGTVSTSSAGSASVCMFTLMAAAVAALKLQ